jgi:hypothetical protein
MTKMIQVRSNIRCVAAPEVAALADRVVLHTVLDLRTRQLLLHS